MDITYNDVRGICVGLAFHGSEGDILMRAKIVIQRQKIRTQNLNIDFCIDCGFRLESKAIQNIAVLRCLQSGGRSGKSILNWSDWVQVVPGGSEARPSSAHINARHRDTS